MSTVKLTKVKLTKVNLGMSHKVIENKEKEEGLDASLLIMLMVNLLGRSSIASW